MISTSKCSFAFENYPVWQNPQYASFNNPNLGSFDIDTLNYLENSLYGKNYPHNSTASRLKKLEKTIFGINTYGTNSERLKRLSDAYVKYKQSNLYSSNPQSTKQKLRKLSKVLFQGVPTGYTPPVRQYHTTRNNYNPHYINPSGYSYERVYCDTFGNCSPYLEDIQTNMGVKIIRN